MAVKAESAMSYEATSPEALFSLLITILAIGEFYASIQTLGFFFTMKKVIEIEIGICIGIIALVKWKF